MSATVKSQIDQENQKIDNILRNVITTLHIIKKLPKRFL